MKGLSKLDYILGFYIALYIGIPANGIDQILGFNLHVLVLLLAFALFLLTIPGRKISSFAWRYVGFQIFSAFACVIASFQFADFNMYGAMMNFFQFSLFILMLCEVPNEGNINFYIFSFVVGALFNSLLSIGGQYLGLNVIEYTGYLEDRIMILGRDANEMALILNIACAMALYLIRTKYMVIPSIVTIATSFMAIIVTGSRTGMIALGILILINFFLNQGSTKSKIFYVIVSAFMLFIAFFILTHFVEDSILERYLMIGEEIESGSMANRRYLWDDCIKTFSESNVLEFLIGHGYNTTRLFTFNQHDAHNVFLKVLVEFGIVGFIVLIRYLSFFVFSAFKTQSNNEKFFIICVLFIVLISFMTLSWIYNLIIWIVFILVHQSIRYNLNQ